MLRKLLTTLVIQYSKHSTQLSDPLVENDLNYLTGRRIVGYSMDSNPYLSYSTGLLVIVDIIIQSSLLIFTYIKVDNVELQLLCATNALL